MNLQLVQEIANAVLYEGYILYPYRASAIKNRQRWNFGVVAPDGIMRTECLIQAPASTSVGIRVRFLQLVERTETGSAAPPWQEAIEREVGFQVELGSPLLRQPFVWAGETSVEGTVFRIREAITGAIEAESTQVNPEVFQIRVCIRNLSPVDERALLRSLISTHTILSSARGSFVSLIDPPEQFRAIADGCRNEGTWPVLAGEPGETDAMLSSPIILYDYPQIAPESPGALFDGTEIDEILTLRIMTMTDAEKSEMRDLDDRTRQILERTESLPAEHFMKLHGVLRTVPRTTEAK